LINPLFWPFCGVSENGTAFANDVRMQEYMLLIFSWIIGFTLVSCFTLNGLRKIGAAVKVMVPIPIREKNR
jgi:hypothetical protein